jgi:hypothetical protein
MEGETLVLSCHILVTQRLTNSRDTTTRVEQPLILNYYELIGFCQDVLK